MRSKLHQAAKRLFEQHMQTDEDALWNYLVAGIELPETPEVIRLQLWAYKRWGVDFADDHATVPSL